MLFLTSAFAYASSAKNTKRTIKIYYFSIACKFWFSKPGHKTMRL